MKRALMVLPVLSLVLTFGFGAEAKSHKNNKMKAYLQQCKDENPGMKKKDLKKCAKEKSKSGAAA